MKVIKVTEAAYNVLAALSEETEKPISEVASTLIINKDREIRISERVVKELITRGNTEKVTE